jgi:cell division protein FtsI/penicillin-binding protein 2
MLNSRYGRNAQRSNNNLRRLNVLLFSFALLFLIAELRLFQIQVISHKKYSVLAEEQYWDYQTLLPKRGNILSSDKYILAGNQIFYLLYAEPKNISDPYKFSHDLATVLADLKFQSQKPVEGQAPITREDIFSGYYDNIFKSVSKDLYWVPLEHNLTPNDRKVLEDMKIKGIGFEEEPERYYPENTLASHILGFVASNEKGEKIGYGGIEGRLNEDLKGKPGKIMEETDATGTPILIGGYKKVEPVQGRDVVLTIKRPVQYIIEKLLKEGVEKYDAVSGSVIVMDPYTGDVLALANFPTYHPSDFSQSEEKVNEEDRRKTIEKKDLAISNTYEPGSVMKPLTVSAAIDLGLVTPETTYEDKGSAVYSGRTISNWDHKALGVLNIIGLLQKSNNIGAAWVGHLVGSKKLYEYFTSFGLGKKTNIELEGEESGSLRNYEDWRDIDLAVMSFGQGLAATPLQVLNAFNVFANGGYLLEPKIISEIIDGNKEIVMPTKNLRRVISKETAATMVDLLEKAAEGGEAKFFTLKDYRIAGKTGTAEVPDETGGYSSDKTNATFVGFLAGSKRFSMIVRLEEPKTSIYAAETAAPLWMNMATELVKYYGLPPDKQIEKSN